MRIISANVKHLFSYIVLFYFYRQTLYVEWKGYCRIHDSHIWWSFDNYACCFSTICCV